MAIRSLRADGRNNKIMVARTLNLYLKSFAGLSRSAWLLSLVTLINRSGTMVIPFLAIYLTEQRGFTLGQAGMATAFFGVGSLVGSYLGGYLTDRIGYYRVIFWSLFLGGVLFVGFGYVHGIGTIFAGIFVLSTIGESFRPAVMTALAVYSEPETRTRSYSLMRMAINLGFTIGPAAGGFLAGSFGYGSLFWADGLTCVAAAVAFRIWLNPKNAAPKESRLVEEGGNGFDSPYRDKTYLAFIGLNILSGIIFLQLLSALPAFYRFDMQLSKGEIGLLLAFNGLIVFLLEMPLVSILQRKMGVIHSMGTGVLLFGFSYLVLNFSGLGSIALAIVSMAALSVGEIFNMPFANTYAMGRTNENNRGKYMGLYSMSYSTAHIIGPFLSMKVADHWGFSTLWYLVALMSLVTFVGLLGLKRLK